MPSRRPKLGSHRFFLNYPPDHKSLSANHGPRFVLHGLWPASSRLTSTVSSGNALSGSDVVAHGGVCASTFDVCHHNYQRGTHSKSLFYITFLYISLVCATCASKHNLVQKQFLIFNSSVFQLNFFSFWWHTWHTFTLSCCESTTYIKSRGGTQVAHMRHTLWHTPRITVHGGRITRSPLTSQGVYKSFIENFFAKFIYKSLTHYLPLAD